MRRQPFRLGKVARRKARRLDDNGNRRSKAYTVWTLGQELEHQLLLEALVVGSPTTSERYS